MTNAYRNPLTGEIRYFNANEIPPYPWIAAPEWNYACPGSCGFNERTGLPYVETNYPPGFAGGGTAGTLPAGTDTGSTPTFRVNVEYVNWIPWAILLGIFLIAALILGGNK